MMDLQELRDLAKKILDRGIKQLMETGGINQVFFLVKGDNISVFPVPPELTNSEFGKELVGEFLSYIVKAEEMEAVIHVSDTYGCEETPEQTQVRRELKLTLKQAADRGLCVVKEELVCFVESLILCEVYKQEYKRKKEDDSKIELVGGVQSYPMKEQGGRFMFFGGASVTVQ